MFTALSPLKTSVTFATLVMAAWAVQQQPVSTEQHALDANVGKQLS
jgi:hypothetical protein